MTLSFKAFDTSDSLALWLASDIGQQLQKAIENKKTASMAVSGGSTPKQLFTALSKLEIDWSLVTITLVDERWVPMENNRSNAKLVHDYLLQNHAAKANFIPLYRSNLAPDQINEIETDLAKLLPFDVVVLGMGIDGHTASFFPKSNNLSKATNINNKQLLIDIKAFGADEPRVTLTLSALVQAKHLYLHFEGQEKLQIFEQAKNNGPDDALPIRYVLNACSDIHTIWAP